MASDAFFGNVGKSKGERMEPSGPHSVDGKVSKRKKRESPRRNPSSSGKQKATYYLSEEAIQRVGISATMEKKSHSTIIEELITAHLRKWVVSCRGLRVDAAHGSDGAGGDSPEHMSS